MALGSERLWQMRFLQCTIRGTWLPMLRAFLADHHDFEAAPENVRVDVSKRTGSVLVVGNHPRFGINFDPSHFGYQGVDYLAFLREFGAKVWNVHVKDVWWSDRGMPAGVFGSHTSFGDEGRFWDFRSPGRGRIDFPRSGRALHDLGAIPPGR